MVKNIFITGISSGIGKALALAAAESGYRVFGTVRSLENIEFSHPLITFLEMDLCDPASIDAAFNQLKNEFHIDTLYAMVNNAGIAVPGPIAYLAEGEFMKQMQVNVIGPVRCIQQSFPLLLNFGKGSRIINIGSVSGKFASPFLGAYCSSKFALEGLSDSLRREAKLFGIHVILFQPGPVKTEIWAKNLGMAEKFNASPYAEFVKHADTVIARMQQSAFEVEYIAKYFLHSLRSTHPKARYLLHKKSRLLRLLVTFVPTSWIDRLVLRQLTSREKKFRPI